MQGGSNLPFFPRPVIGLTSRFRGLGDQVYACFLECLEDLICQIHAAVGALTDYEKIGASGKHCSEILGEQRVTVSAPPTRDDSFGKDDDILGMRLAVDDNPAEAITLNLGRAHDLLVVLPCQVLIVL